MRKPFRIIRLKQAKQIAKKHVWRQNIQVPVLDAMLSIKKVYLMVHAYYKTEDAYVFHRNDGEVYWVVRRDYIQEKFPKLLAKIEKGGDKDEKKDK